MRNRIQIPRTHEKTWVCSHTSLIPADRGLLELAGYQSRSRFRERSYINGSKANMTTSDVLL